MNSSQRFDIQKVNVVYLNPNGKRESQMLSVLSHNIYKDIENTQGISV